MRAMYDWMEAVLPFEWVAYDFMKNALLAILLVTPLLAVVGTMVVQKKMAYFSDALGHSALTGIAIGVVLGVSNTSASMVIFAVIFALLLNKIKSVRGIGADTIISVFASFSIAVGLVVLSYQGNFNNYSSLLIGDVLSITTGEIKALLILFVVTLTIWGLFYNRLLFSSLNGALARSRGIRVGLLENVFVVLVAVIVMLAIRWIGILLINALMILPVAAAKNISSNVREYHFFAIVFAEFSGVCGLLMSYYLDAASGPVIIIYASILFFASLLCESLQKNRNYS